MTAQRDSLSDAIGSLTITPVAGESDRYTLRPGSHVGAFELDGLSVLIEPKIGIPQLLSLACYAMGAYRLQERRLFDFEGRTALPDALALALGVAARRAFSRGLLHGYRTEEEELQTVRGSIRLDEQMRRRFGVAVPVEVRYDEYTDDILANQLVKAAAWRLSRSRLRSVEARRNLGWISGTLENVSFVEFPPRNVSELAVDRLNRHYGGVVALSRLILRHGAFESGRGDVRASGFLMDMNVVFQEFVTVALREELGLTERAFRSDGQLKGSHRISLDRAGEVRLEPDLTWWDGSKCVFVGDAKYKRIDYRDAPNADLYQLLAYTTALNLPGGMLIYAKGEGKPRVHEVRHLGKRLVVEALDLEQELDGVLGEVKLLGRRIRELRDEAAVF